MKRFILSISVLCLITQSSSAMNLTQEQQHFVQENRALVQAMNYANTFLTLPEEERPRALEFMKNNLDDLIKHATYNRTFYHALPNGGHEEPFYEAIRQMATWFAGNDQYTVEYKKVTDTIGNIVTQRDNGTYSTITREIPMADPVVDQQTDDNQNQVPPHENQTEQTNTAQQHDESANPVIQPTPYRKLVGTALQFFGLGLITFGVALVIFGIIHKIKNKSAQSKKIGVEKPTNETRQS